MLRFYTLLYCVEVFFGFINECIYLYATEKRNNLPVYAFVFSFDKYKTVNIDYRNQKNRTIFVNPKKINSLHFNNL